MVRRKFRQMAANYAKLQFVSSVGDKMKQESEPTYNHFIGCLDGLSRRFANNNTRNPKEDVGKSKARKDQKIIFWLPQVASNTKFAKYLQLCANDSKIYQDIYGIDPYHNTIYGKDAEGILLTRIDDSVVAARRKKTSKLFTKCGSQ